MGTNKINYTFKLKINKTHLEDNEGSATTNKMY